MLFFFQNVQPNTWANIPLPTRFSFRVQKAIERGELVTKEIRLAFVRVCIDYFQPLLPNPGREGYPEIAKKLCDTYLCLKDSNYYNLRRSGNLLLLFISLRKLSVLNSHSDIATHVGPAGR